MPSYIVFKIFYVFAFATITLAQRNPNPCAGKSGQWVNDFGGCPNYFYCQGPDDTLARPVACPEGYGFDGSSQLCTLAFVNIPPCQVCPPDIDGFAVAADETTCTDYVLCVGGNRDANVLSCGPGTRFDRAWGICRLESLVECAPGPNQIGPDCDEAPIDIPHELCDHFWTCVEEGQPAIGPFTCGSDMQFDPASRICVPRTAACTASSKSKEVPHAPVVRAETQPSFRERLMKTLHIH